MMSMVPDALRRLVLAAGHPPGVPLQFNRPPHSDFVEIVRRPWSPKIRIYPDAAKNILKRLGRLIGPIGFQKGLHLRRDLLGVIPRLGFQRPKKMIGRLGRSHGFGMEACRL